MGGGTHGLILVINGASQFHEINLKSVGFCIFKHFYAKYNRNSEFAAELYHTRCDVSFFFSFIPNNLTTLIRAAYDFENQTSL